MISNLIALVAWPKTLLISNSKNHTNLFFVTKFSHAKSVNDDSLGRLSLPKKVQPIKIYNRDFYYL